MLDKNFNFKKRKLATQGETLDGQLRPGVFKTSVFNQLMRFLVLGTEGGTYYAGQRELTMDNIKCLGECLNQDYMKTIDIIATISDEGRAANNNYAIFALALAASHESAKVRQLALSKLSVVCRTSTHLFDFMTYLKARRGFGRAVRRAIGGWYTNRDIGSLEYQVVKYRQRNGWTHRDVLRLAHVQPNSKERNLIFNWVVKGFNQKILGDMIKSNLDLILSYEVMNGENATLDDVLEILSMNDVPREAIPTHFVNEAPVWRLMLENGMPMNAMVRNLRNMSNYGVFNSEYHLKIVLDTLEDADQIRRSRLHPISILKALFAYKQTDDRYWAIEDRLEKAFYLSFGNIKPSHKRIAIGLDVSGSMGLENMMGISGLTPRVGAAAMVMATVHAEENVKVYTFSSDIDRMYITKDSTLESVLSDVDSRRMGSTDCALLINHALQRREEYDAFVVYTDSETNVGWRSTQPAAMLHEYNRIMGTNAKLIVVGMTATDASIADPNDPKMLDVVGFDTATPSLISEFISMDGKVQDSCPQCGSSNLRAIPMSQVIRSTVGCRNCGHRWESNR